MALLSEALEQEVRDRKAEIGRTDAQMINGVFVIFTLMTIAFIANATHAERQRLVEVFAVSAAWWVCRGDYMIHRLAAYISAVLGGKERFDWEMAKRHLKSKLFMLPIDLAASSGPIWMLWQTISPTPILSNAQFIQACVVGVVAGVLASIGMVKLAWRRW